MAAAVGRPGLHNLATFPPQIRRWGGIAVQVMQMKLWFTTPIFAAMLATATTGCVRTSDGSIQPGYAPTIGRAGPVPVVMFEPVRHQPSDTLRYRPAPSPEPPPEAFNPPPVYRAARPTTTSSMAQVEPLASTVSCGPMATATGRVRVECR